MTTTPGSAKIYQFPARGLLFLRAAVLPPRRATKRRRRASRRSRAVRVTAGSGWYHEEAIRDAERRRDQ